MLNTNRIHYKAEDIKFADSMLVFTEDGNSTSVDFTEVCNSDEFRPDPFSIDVSALQPHLERTVRM